MTTRTLVDSSDNQTFYRRQGHHIVYESGSSFRGELVVVQLSPDLAWYVCPNYKDEQVPGTLQGPFDTKEDAIAVMRVANRFTQPPEE